MNQNKIKNDSAEYARDMIFKLLERNGKRQIDLADEIGVSRFVVSQWKRGVSSSFTDAENINKIAHYLGVTTDYVLGKDRQYNDDDLNIYVSELKNRPELLELMKIAKSASKADIERAIKIIAALK